MKPDDSTIANAVFDILVADCGASEHDRGNFIFHITLGCREYRCCFALGFGGKFCPETMSVDYYSEDKTPGRDRIQTTVNWKLRDLAERMST